MASFTAEKIGLRRATPEDFEMALNLYLVTMKPLTAELVTWDENKQSTFFAEQWNVDDVQIITREGRNVGWVQQPRWPQRFSFNSYSSCLSIKAEASDRKSCKLCSSIGNERESQSSSLN
jgi:hypothetical protein